MTELRRQAIDDLLEEHDSETINPSLWLQKGLPEPSTDNSTAKTEYLTAISQYTAPPFYLSAFNRWFDLTVDAARFCQCVMTLDQRLLIGLTGNGALETGCSLSRNYGMPYIPGSSIKGVVRAWSEQNLKVDYLHDISELFGTRDSDDFNRVSGLVTFHDAWWIPDSENTEHKPFVLDVVTPHHQEYYNGGKAEPSDKDSPIPNHLLSVQGSFLFVIEGKPEHVALCQTMLMHVLTDRGIGAKTSAGYGYMKTNLSLYSDLQEKATKRLPPEILAKRRQEEQERQQQAENDKSVAQVCVGLESEYKTHSDHEEYRKNLEKRIDYAIQHWVLDDRLTLAKCLKNLGYIPTNKKNKNRALRINRLQQLRGEK
jgi:CRISPR-associated protein Cmr6